MKKKHENVFTLISGKEAVEALDDPEKMRTIYEQICEALGIEPVRQEGAVEPNDDRPLDEVEPGGAGPGKGTRE